MSVTMPVSTQVVGTQANTRVVRLQGGGLRFLDVHDAARGDVKVVTRPFHGFDATQYWRLIDLGGGECCIQHASSGRFLDAYEVAARDFRAITRPRRGNDTQRWRLEDLGGGFVTVQQVSSGRFLEAVVDGDFGVVTRPAGDNEQTWRIGEP
jgi:hypothetical protein